VCGCKAWFGVTSKKAFFEKRRFSRFSRKVPFGVGNGLFRFFDKNTLFAFGLRNNIVFWRGSRFHPTSVFSYFFEKKINKKKHKRIFFAQKKIYRKSNFHNPVKKSCFWRKKMGKKRVIIAIFLIIFSFRYKRSFDTKTDKKNAKTRAIKNIKKS